MHWLSKNDKCAISHVQDICIRADIGSKLADNVDG